MPIIQKVHAREVLDSRGFPSVEVEVYTKNGVFGRAIVPSGASTGSKEALELRDHDLSRYKGKGVLKAVENVNAILSKLVIGMSVLQQRKIDDILIQADGTCDKSKYGANAILGISLAVAHCAANYLHMPLYEYIGGIQAHILPVPMMNIINGGSHAQNSMDIQEYMIMPIGAKSFSQALQMGSEIFHTLKSILSKNGFSTGLGDEGGFAPNFQTNEEAFHYIVEAISQAGYIAGEDVGIAIDVAASEFYDKNENIYVFKKSDGHKKTSEEMINWYETLMQQYPILSIEDGLDENDWQGWIELTKRLGKKVQLVGDDLFVSNEKILKEGIIKEAANAILLKVNQIGTLSEAMDTVALAKKQGYRVILSHRSGESEDVTIADLAVGLSSGEIKTGSLARSERIAKYNQLLRIEESLSKPAFPGKCL